MQAPFIVFCYLNAIFRSSWYHFSFKIIYWRLFIIFGILSVTRQLLSTSGRKDVNLIIRQTQLCVPCACPCCCRALCARYNITNIWCDCGQYIRIFSRGTLNCMDELYGRRPMLASGNIAHPWNSRFLGKILLYDDHNGIDEIKQITKLSII